MSKLRRVESPQFDRFQGYIDAAQHIFTKGELDVTLEATLFEIQSAVTDEDVLSNSYPDSDPIEHRSETTVGEMVANINELLTIKRGFWKPQYAAAGRIETELREGYWKHLGACFDYKDARVVQLGDHVPYVNIDQGFTYILYARDMSQCILLVGNTSD